MSNISLFSKSIKSIYFLHDRYLAKGLNTDFTLGNCLFGAPEVTKNADLKKYANSGYGIRFDTRSEFFLIIKIKIP